MNIDSTFIRNIMRIVHGSFVLKIHEAEALRALLGSREEFLAWLLLRNKLAVTYPEIGLALVDVASSSVVTSSTRRKESAPSPYEREDMLKMETAIKTLLEASKASDPAAHEVNVAVTSFAARHGNDALLGKVLGIKTS